MKNSKEKHHDSLNKTIVYTKNDNKLNVQIPSCDNFVDNYIKSEINKIIYSVVMELPEREREIIMMYYGFYDNHHYKGREIIEKFGISDTWFNKVKKRTLKEIARRLLELGVIDYKKTLFK